MVDGGEDGLGYARPRRVSGGAGWAWASLVAGGMALGWEVLIVLGGVRVIHWPTWVGGVMSNYGGVVVGLFFGLPFVAFFCGCVVMWVSWRVKPSRADYQRAGAGMVMGLVTLLCGCGVLGMFMPTQN